MAHGVLPHGKRIESVENAFKNWTSKESPPGYTTDDVAPKCYVNDRWTKTVPTTWCYDNRVPFGNTPLLSYAEIANVEEELAEKYLYYVAKHSPKYPFVRSFTLPYRPLQPSQLPSLVQARRHLKGLYSSFALKGTSYDGRFVSFPLGHSPLFSLKLRLDLPLLPSRIGGVSLREWTLQETPPYLYEEVSLL